VSRRTRNSLAPAVVLLAWPALAQSEAERVASRTGEIIGAASACGVSDDELIALGRKVIGWARDAARDAAELRRAQGAHEAAVQRGAARIKRAARSGCGAAVQAFRELEGERR
jgi:hypothetical protein